MHRRRWRLREHLRACEGLIYTTKVPTKRPLTLLGASHSLGPASDAASPPHLVMHTPRRQVAAAVCGYDGRVWNYFASQIVRGRIQWRKHVRVRVRGVLLASYPFDALEAWPIYAWCSPGAVD